MVRFRYLLLFFVVCSSFLGVQSANSEVREFTYEGVSSRKSPAIAKRDILKDAPAAIAAEQIETLIGKERIQKNRATVRKILKESEKYILYLRPGTIEPTQNGFAMPVTVRLSIDSLKKLLREEGLLYQQGGIPKILPLVSMVDRVRGGAYHWWITEAAEQRFLSSEMKDFHGTLHESLAKKNFFSYQPNVSGLSKVFPAGYRRENYRTDDYLFLGEYYSADMILYGDIHLLPSKELSEGVQIKVKLTALHTNNGRIVAEVSRLYETASGDFENVVHGKLTKEVKELVTDLAQQIIETWEKGLFGANLMKISVRGRLNYKEVVELKQYLQKEIKAIKSIREKSLGSGRVDYEVDASGSLRELAGLLKRLRWKGRAVRVTNIDTDSGAVVLSF